MFFTQLLTDWRLNEWLRAESSALWFMLWQTILGVEYPWWRHSNDDETRWTYDKYVN
jgi:hypothetical protein